MNDFSPLEGLLFHIWDSYLCQSQNLSTDDVDDVDDDPRLRLWTPKPSHRDYFGVIQAHQVIRVSEFDASLKKPPSIGILAVIASLTFHHIDTDPPLHSFGPSEKTATYRWRYI